MAQTTQTSPETSHVAIMPSPGMGHLIPLAELAKRLVASHSICVTFITLTTDASSPQFALVNNLVKSDRRKSINSVDIPSVSMDDVPNDAKIETRISLIVKRSLPSLRQALKTIISTNPISALIVDLFGTDAFDVAKEFRLQPYVFFPTTAAVLSLMLYLPTLDSEISGEYRDLDEPVKVPGCLPFHGKYLLDPLQDRKNEAYTWFLHQSVRFREAKGFMVNTFEELEPETIRALRAGDALKLAKIPTPPVFPVGPLTAEEGTTSTADCLSWLDQQPTDSVLFVSFGSGGTLSLEQFRELAWGLEMSQQRFLWVAKSPQRITNAAFFTSDSSQNPLDFLPEGFLSRTKNLGLVLPSWAPQVQVLAHSSTGGFVSHCGWNSTLESIVNGVPLIAWPLYAEQKMNALMLVGELKIALRPQMGENGVVGREEIARVVKGLMEGEVGKRVRNRVQELRDAGSSALAEGGSSYKSLSEVSQQWKKATSM